MRTDTIPWSRSTTREGQWISPRLTETRANTARSPDLRWKPDSTGSTTSPKPIFTVPSKQVGSQGIFIFLTNDNISNAKQNVFKSDLQLPPPFNSERVNGLVAGLLGYTLRIFFLNKSGDVFLSTNLQHIPRTTDKYANYRWAYC